VVRYEIEVGAYEKVAKVKVILSCSLVKLEPHVTDTGTDTDTDIRDAPIV